MGPLFHCSSDPTFRRVLTQCRFRNSGLVLVAFSQKKKQQQYCSVNLDHPLPTPRFFREETNMCQQISVQQNLAKNPVAICFPPFLLKKKSLGFEISSTLRIIGPSYRGVWICIAGFWDLQTTRFEIP